MTGIHDRRVSRYIILLITILVAMILGTIEAHANVKSDPDTIRLNQSEVFEFTGDDWPDHYYEFTAPASGYYEVKIADFGWNSSYINIYDSEDEQVAFAAWDETSDNVRCATWLTKGKKYIIEIDVFVPEYYPSRCVSTTVTEHVHNYIVEQNYDSAEYEHCATQGCGFGKFVFTKRVSITRLAADRKAFEIEWKSYSKIESGYEIQYSTSADFKEAETKSIIVKDAYSKKIKVADGDTTYYVRIRPYTKCDICNYGKEHTCYGVWSYADSVDIE